MREFTAVYRKDGDWWIGWPEELSGANGQGRTLDEARESLKAAVVDVLAANREIEAMDYGEPLHREVISVASA